MSEANKALCRRLFEEIWNRRNLAVIDECYASNFTEHTVSGPDFGAGPQAARKLVQFYQSAFPDTRMTSTTWSLRATKLPCAGPRAALTKAS